MEDLQYPIGRYVYQGEYTTKDIFGWIKQIKTLPEEISELFPKVSEQDWDKPYRPNGWTFRQVIHHLADSHLNGYLRFKTGLTEEVPQVKTYQQESWAETPDNQLSPEISLALLESLHKRWWKILNNLSEADFERKVSHPENGEMTLIHLLQLYAWHGRHHLAHLQLFV